MILYLPALQLFEKQSVALTLGFCISESQVDHVLPLQYTC